MVEKLQRRFALSRKGRCGHDKGAACCAHCKTYHSCCRCICCIALCRICSAARSRPRASCFTPPARVICAAVILVCTYLQYNSTFLATYIETGVRRMGLAESCAGYRFRFRKEGSCRPHLGYHERLRGARNEPVAPYLSAHRRDNINNAYCDFAVYIQLAHGACVRVGAAGCILHSRPCCRSAEKSSRQNPWPQGSAARTAFRSVWSPCPICVRTTPKGAILTDLTKSCAHLKAALQSPSLERRCLLLPQASCCASE